MKKTIFIYAIIFIWLLIPSLVTAENTARVSFLEGTAYRIPAETSDMRPLAEGDGVVQGDQIKTDKASRIELVMPDGSVLRFDEDTIVKMESVAFEPQIESRDIQVNLVLGKIWSNVTKMFGVKNEFSVSTKTAIAGVRGTVFRVNANADDSASVNVYWGEISVSRLAAQKSPDLRREQVSKPERVEGPKRIAGPRKVSVEEWTYILKSMQQIDIKPDGTPSKPFSFSPDQDNSDWVRWNKTRDQKKK